MLEKWLDCQKKEKGSVPFFQPVYKGIKFSSWVGMLQVGDLSIEILPKVSRTAADDPVRWKSLLLRMLARTKNIPLYETDLQLQTLSRQPLSDIFLTAYIRELDALIRKGLLKAYRKEAKNRRTLKGKLDFSRNIKYNAFHQELFYTNATVYDYQSLFNRILIQALRCIRTVPCVKTDAKRILDTWGGLTPVAPDAVCWQKPMFDRRTDGYRKAMLYAKMILTGYNPSLRQGSLPVISFLFDMNRLFEAYVFQTLRRTGRFEKIMAQSGGKFWRNMILRPDILAEYNGQEYVLDTKWKRLDQYSDVAENDLRQIFAYCHKFSCDKGYLVYPLFDGCPSDLQAQPYKVPAADDVSARKASCGIKFFDLFSTDPLGCIDWNM